MNRTNMVLGASFVLFTVWIVTVLGVRPTFLNNLNSNPLAMINSLFPFFWVILSAYLLLFLMIVHMRVDKAAIHILMLVQLSLVLYFTPIALSGFSWSPDSLWLGAVAKYVPDVLAGEGVMFSVYAKTYPLSFILTHCITEVTGIDVFAFSRLYPLFSIVSLTLLGYVLASRILNRTAAFISMLFVIPGWHYLDLHACPHLTGLLLLLTTIIFLTHRGGRQLGIVFFLTLSLILSHPVSPLNLILFCLSAYICVTVLRKRFAGETEVTRWIITNLRSVEFLLLALGIGWISWLLYRVFPINTSIEGAILRTLTFDFGAAILRAREFSIGGGSFVYPEIFDLTRLTYVIFLLVGGVLIFYDLFILVLKNKRKVDDSFLRGLIAFSPSFSFLALSYLLLLGTGDHHLLYRGAIPFVLMISIFLASHYPARRQSKKAITIFYSLMMFLFLVFPIVSYGISGYNSYQYSEGLGVKFIAENVDLSGKSVSTGTDQQLSPYVDLRNVFGVIRFPPNLTETRPEIVVLRKSSFYVIAMRYDLSFEDNRYLRLSDELEENFEYNKIYSNPTTESYVLNK